MPNTLARRIKPCAARLFPGTPYRRSAGRGGPRHRSIMVLDLTGFGGWDNRAQLRARVVLRAAVRSAFRASGVRWSRLSVEDRGDGLIVLVPATVCKVALIDPWLAELTSALEVANAGVRQENRLRLRVVLHAGEVHRDRAGWAGSDLNLACRLVGNAHAYRLLRDLPETTVALTVSPVIYDGVVRHGYRRIDPREYRRIRVVAKEVDTAAWLRAGGGQRADSAGFAGGEPHQAPVHRGCVPERDEA